MGGTAPYYENVLWPGGDGFRVPTNAIGVAGSVSTLSLVRYHTHDYGAAAADWLISPAGQESSYIVVTNASGAANAVWPAAYPGQIYAVFNNSGQAITFKVTGQSGVAVANGKRAFLVMGTADLARMTADT